MKHAYLTCELKGRDLDSRILIAAHLLKRGVNVVIGQQWSMFDNAATCPPGVFLFKSANHWQADWLTRCRDAGHRTAVSDEEALAVVSPFLIRQATSVDAVRNTDLYMFQDENHAAVLREMCPEVKGEVLGNARIDLLHILPQLYALEAAACKAAGPYVLVNTSFGLTNSAWGSRERALQAAIAAKHFDPETAEGRAFMEDWLTTEDANFVAVQDLLRWLSDHARTHRIVVRPHPAENVDVWRNFKRTELVIGSTPIPWMMGADLVIHTNSTTGLESIILGTPTLNLCPRPDSAFSNMYVTRRVNRTIGSMPDAIAAIDALLTRKAGPLRAFKPKMDYRRGAAERIADRLAALAPSSRPITNWQVLLRAETQRRKFTVTMEEFQRRAALIFAEIGVAPAGISSLGDSLFKVDASA